MTMFFAVQFWMMAAPDSALPENPVRPPISMAPSFARIATSSSELSVRWSVLMTQPARPPRSLTPVSFAISPDAVTFSPVAWQFSTSVPSSPPMRTPAHWAKMSLEPESFQHAFRLFSSSLPRPLGAAAREFPRIRVLVPRHRGARPKGMYQRHSQISPFPCHPATASSGMVRAPVIQSLQ